MSELSFSNIGLENGESFKMPKGTIQLGILTKNVLFDQDKNYVIFEFFAGLHIFILEITDEYIVNFIHSSPSSGSRNVKIDISEIIFAEEINIYCIWSNDQITLSVFSTNPKSDVLSKSSQNSELEYRIFENKIIFFKSDFEIMNFRMKSENSTLEPFAVELWNNIKKSLIILRDNSSLDNSVYNSVLSNLAIVALVTGFENYCKNRFVELYEEGVKPNLELLLQKMVSQVTNDKINNSVGCGTISESAIFFEIFKNINFQNLKKCSEAFKYGYNINFFQLGLTHNDINKIKSLIQFRHKIVHFSPLVSVELDTDSFSKEILKNGEGIKNSLILFDDFITKLHSQTLQFGK